MVVKRPANYKYITESKFILKEYISVNVFLAPPFKKYHKENLLIWIWIWMWVFPQLFFFQKILEEESQGESLSPTLLFFVEIHF